MKGSGYVSISSRDTLGRDTLSMPPHFSLTLSVSQSASPFRPQPQEITKIRELEKTIAVARCGGLPQSLAAFEQTLRDTVDTARARNRMLAYCGALQPGQPLGVESVFLLASPKSASMLEFCAPPAFELDDDEAADEVLGTSPSCQRVGGILLLVLLRRLHNS